MFTLIPMLTCFTFYTNFPSSRRCELGRFFMAKYLWVRFLFTQSSQEKVRVSYNFDQYEFNGKLTQTPQSKKKTNRLWGPSDVMFSDISSSYEYLRFWNTEYSTTRNTLEAQTRDTSPESKSKETRSMLKCARSLCLVFLFFRFRIFSSESVV